MPKLNGDELEKVLEILFTEMQKKGMLPANIDNKQQLILTVARQLDSNCEIQKEELRDPKVQKSLCFTLVSAIVTEKYPDLKMDYTLLFKDHQATPAEEIKKELQQQISKTLTAMNQLQLNPAYRLTPTQILTQAEEIADTLTQQFMKSDDPQAKLMKNEHTINVFEEMMTSALRNLYGGVDPRYPGGTPRPIQTTLGNMQGYANYTAPTEASFMGHAQKTEFQDLAKPDYSGGKAVTLLSEIMHSFESQLQEANLLKGPATPFDMKPPNPFNH